MSFVVQRQETLEQFKQVQTQMTQEALNEFIATEVTQTEISRHISDSRQLVQAYYDVAETWMCSKNCPCLAADYLNHRTTPESQLNLRGRTKKLSDFTQILLYFYSRTGNETIDYFPVNFAKCYSDWKLDWQSYSNKMAGRTPGRGGGTDWQRDAQASFQAIYFAELHTPDVEFALELMQSQEELFDCAGALGDERIRLFYVQRHYNLENGNPKGICSDEQIETAAAEVLKKRATVKYEAQLFQEVSEAQTEDSMTMTYSAATLALLAYFIF